MARNPANKMTCTFCGRPITDAEQRVAVPACKVTTWMRGYEITVVRSACHLDCYVRRMRERYEAHE